MARTYRRRGCQYDYPFALWAFEPCRAVARTKAVRRQLARFHSDKRVGYRLPPPRVFRRGVDGGMRTRSRELLRQWVMQQDFEPLFPNVRRCSAWMPM
ncbi:hypothetical protein ACVW0A_000663 [Pseudomonas sp. TE3610]